MRRILTISTLTLLASCGSYQLKSIDGVERVSINQDRYVKPQFYVKKFKPTKTSRSIASAQVGLDISNKKAYFLSLYKQHAQFAQLANIDQQINSCPQFHNDLLTYKDELSNRKVSKANLDFSEVLIDKSKITSYPVLSLPYRNTDLYSYISDNNKWDQSETIALSAIKSYAQSMRKEIETMCEFGNSNDYYIFENMISYYRNNLDFIYSFQALPSVLKVSPIANIFLLESLQSKSEKVSIFEDRLMAKMNIPWFKNYLYEVSLIRNNKSKRFVLKD
jgi:hypothetical protein